MFCQLGNQMIPLGGVWSTFTCKPTSPKLVSPANILTDFYTPSQYPPALINRGPLTRQPGSAPTTHSPLELFKLINPNPAHLASPIPSHENYNVGCYPWFPLTLSASNWPWCFPMWPCKAWCTRSSWELSQEWVLTPVGTVFSMAITPCVPCDHLYKETTYGSSFPCSLCPRIPGHQKVTKSRDIKKSVPLDLLHHPCRLTLTSPSNRILPLLENVLRGPTVSPVHPALGCGKSVPQVCAWLNPNGRLGPPSLLHCGSFHRYVKSRGVPGCVLIPKVRKPLTPWLRALKGSVAKGHIPAT